MSVNGLPQKPGQAPPGRPSAPANLTLYVRNLNDKISKTDLRRALYTLFTTYGPVLDVVALKTQKMRGQAHIVMRDKICSAQAMEALQGFEFLGRPMQISYAKSKSDIVARLDGSAKLPEVSKPQPATNPNRAPQNAIPPKPSQPPTGSLKAPDGLAENGSKSPQGTKRARDEESDAESEQEDDEGEEMDVSD